jgi:Domain of unknown function (DUF4276)
MTLYIVPIVEGQTEQGCVERLLHRVWAELLSQSERLQVLEPFRGQRDALIHPSGKVLTDSVGKAFLKLQAKTRQAAEARSLVLILLDAEGDCPATLAPRLLEVARRALPADARLACVLARRMLENWIMAGASPLAGVNGLPHPLPPRDQFEERSGVTWLESQLRGKNPKRSYKKTADAKVFVQHMNLVECRGNCPSFDKLCRELEGRPVAPAPRREPGAAAGGMQPPQGTDTGAAS